MTEQQSDEQQQPAETKVEIDCSRPGELLKAAREAQGLTQIEVAEKLNFLPNYIPALENEEFEPLHSVTFIKGYLRAYARFLDIDADEVLRCFALHHPELITPEKHQPVQVMKSEKTTSSLAFKFISLVILVGLVAIIIIWWQSRTTESLPSASNQDVQVDTLDGNTIIAPIKTDTLEVTQPDEPSVQKKTPESPASLDEPTQTLATEPKTEPAVVEAQPTTPQPAAPKPEVEKPKPPVAEAAAPKPQASPKTLVGDPAAATLGNDELVALKFSGECWVEVRDDAGRTLHAALMQENDQILLQGKPPFKMVFGNGTFAQVFYAGEAFDLASHIRPNGYASILVE